MIPLFNLAQSKVGGNGLRRQSIKNLTDVIGLDAMQDDQRLAGNPDID